MSLRPPLPPGFLSPPPKPTPAPAPAPAPASSSAHDAQRTFASLDSLTRLDSDEDDDNADFPPSISQRHVGRPSRGAERERDRALDLRGGSASGGDGSTFRAGGQTAKGHRTVSGTSTSKTAGTTPRIVSGSGGLLLPLPEEEETRALRHKRSFDRTKAWAAEMGWSRTSSRDGTEDGMSSTSRSDLSYGEVSLPSPAPPRTPSPLPARHKARPPRIITSDPLAEEPASPTASALASSLLTPTPILSIDEIVRLHSAGVTGAMHAAKDKARRELGLASAPLPPPTPLPMPAARTQPLAATPLLAPSADPRPALGLGRVSPSSESAPRSSSPVPSRAGARTPSLGTPLPTRRPLTQRAVSAPLPPPAQIPVPEPPRNTTHEMALHLRSADLNKFLTIPRPYPYRPLRVSYAQVGRPDGHPVLLFLGLGCVRYLVALYDELALAFGIRLICVDRWGYGKTDQVDAMDRGMVEWTGVMGKVCEQLGIERCQVVAHSAGAPYALAMAKRWPPMIKGKVHLLAPWVGQQHDSVSKWLKWVPGSVIKTATAADHRLQTMFIGRAPKLAFAPVSFDARAARATEAAAQGDVPTSAGCSPRGKPIRQASEDGLSVKSSPSMMRRASTAFRRSKPPSLYGSIGAASTISLASPFGNGLLSPPGSGLGSVTGQNQSRISLSLGPGVDAQGSLGRSPGLLNLRNFASMAVRGARGSAKALDGRLASPLSFESDRSDRTPTASTSATDTMPVTPRSNSLPLGTIDDDEGDVSGHTAAELGLGEGFETFGTDLQLVLPSLLSGEELGGFSLGGLSIDTGTNAASKADARLDDPISLAVPISPSCSTSSASSAPAARQHAPSAPASAPAGILPVSTSTTSSTFRPLSRYPATPAFALAIQQAAHAECEPGTTSDILRVIVNRPHRPYGFRYEDVSVPMRVWWGTEDKLISARSVRWMETECGAEVDRRAGEGHNLLSSPGVVCDLFRCLGEEARRG